MNKNLLSLIVFIFSYLIGNSQTADPVLFELKDSKVHVSEFKYIYEKNNRDNADYSKKSLSEYLELYKKFKLKVQKARDMKLDTIPSLKSELAGYRRQLAKSYLVDNEVSDRLVREVFNRQQKDRKIAHIFFKLDKYASPDEVNKKKNLAQETYNKLKEGADFAILAKRLSQDKITAKKAGVLGYFTAPMPDGFYDLETAMCNLKPGEISKPVKSQLGFHIIKLIEERPARGEMEIAHILIKKKLKSKQLVNAKSLVDSIYMKLKNNESFETLAKNYSHDKKTASKGGYLGFFGIGKYEPVFEEAAFAIKKDGDYSPIIESDIGYHIIKRISKQDNTNYDLSKKRIKTKIIKDSRFEKAKKTLIERIKKDAHFKYNQNVLNRFISTLDKDFYSYGWKSKSEDNSELISFGNTDKYSIKEFTAYCKSQGRLRARYLKKKDIKETVNELLEMFIDEKAISYEERNLEAKYPDFKSLMREYEEGILLFEATKLNVWDKASKDSTGLAEFYSLHKSNYTWKERAHIEEILIDSDNKKLIKKIYKCAKKKSKTKDKLLKKFNKKSDVLAINSSLIERTSNMAKGIKWKKGARSKPMIDSKNSRSSFIRITGFEPAGMKSLNEAKGYVIADYQDYLESIWVKKLKLEYPIKVNEEVFKSLIK